MSFWKSVSNFLSNPVVRGVSAVAGAAGAGGAFDSFGSVGDTLTKIAGAANIATGAASALNRNQSGLSRALGVGQIGLGGFNVLQGGVELPFGGGKVGGFGSVSSWLQPGNEAINSGTVSGSGWSLSGEDEAGRVIYSDPLPALPGTNSAMPSNAQTEIFGLSNSTPRVSVANEFASPGGTTMAALPAPPEMAPGRSTFFGNGQLTDFETMTGGSVAGQTTGSIATPSGGYVTGGAARAPTYDFSGNRGMQMPTVAGGPSAMPSSGQVAFNGQNVLGPNDRMLAQLADGMRVMRADGTIEVLKDTAKALPFFDRIANAAMNDPMKAMSAVAMVGGLVGQMFQPSVQDIYKDMASKYDPDSANGQQFMADFKERARREATKQHNLLTEQLRGTMADRGMADSSVHYAAKAELDKGLTETIANLDWNAWQAWNQYARSMGATQMQTAQSASLLAGNPTSFANVSRIIAKTA